MFFKTVRFIRFHDFMRYYQKLWIGENPEEMKKAAYPIS